MSLQVPCLSCREPVAVPLPVFLTSTARSRAVRAAAGRVWRPDQDVVCARCATRRAEVFKPRESAWDFVIGTGVVGAVLIVLVAVVVVYPSLTDAHTWRWERMHWPQTDGGMLGVLGVLVTILVAVGLDLPRQLSGVPSSRKLWRHNDRAIDLDVFRDLQGRFDQLDQMRMAVILTVSAAFGIAGISLAKGLLTAHIESVVTGIVAAIVVFVGQIITMNRVRGARDRLGLTRAGLLVEATRRWRRATAWEQRVGVLTSRRLAAPVIGALAPALGAVAAGATWGWNIGTGLLVLHGMALVISGVVVVTRANALGASRSEIVACALLGAVILLLLVAVTAWAALWVGAARDSWAVFLVVLSGAWASQLSVLLGAALRIPGGGGLLAVLARHVRYYRRIAAVPAIDENYFVLVTSAEDRLVLGPPACLDNRGRGVGPEPSAAR